MFRMKSAGESSPSIYSSGSVVRLDLHSASFSNMNKEKNTSQLAGMVCGGCLFIGMGIGWAMGSLRWACSSVWV